MGLFSLTLRGCTLKGGFSKTHTPNDANKVAHKCWKEGAQVSLNFTFSVGDMKVIKDKGVASAWRGCLECLSLDEPRSLFAADCWRDAQVWSSMQDEQNVLCHYGAERNLCPSKRGRSQSASHTPPSWTPFVSPVAFHTGRRESRCVKKRSLKFTL